MIFSADDEPLCEGLFWGCTIFSLVSAGALVAYNLIRSKKSYPFIVVGFILVTALACFLIEAVIDELFPFPIPLSFLFELECCLIIIYSFTVINGLRERNLIIIIVNLITLALASAYPIAHMFFTKKLTTDQTRIYWFAFAAGMGVSALISLFYGFISSRGKSLPNKIFCMQFGVICLLVGLSHLLVPLMMEEFSKNMLYFMLITCSLFPLSCLGLSKGLGDNIEETDTLL